MARYGDMFLRERWTERDREERNEPTPEEVRQKQDIELFLDMRKQLADDESGLLMKLFRDMEDYAVRYQQKVMSNARVRFDVRGNQAGVRDLESSDENRRLAHETLIDAVNILSRQFQKNDLDNEWRRKIGLSRDDVGRFAESIAGMIYRTFEDKAL